MSWYGFEKEFEDDASQAEGSFHYFQKPCHKKLLRIWLCYPPVELELNVRPPALVTLQKPSAPSFATSPWHKPMAQTDSFSIQHVSPRATNPLGRPLCCYGNLRGITTGRAPDGAPALHSPPQINLFCYWGKRRKRVREREKEKDEWIIKQGPWLVPSQPLQQIKSECDLPKQIKALQRSFHQGMFSSNPTLIIQTCLFQRVASLDDTQRRQVCMGSGFENHEVNSRHRACGGLFNTDGSMPAVPPSCRGGERDILCWTVMGGVGLYAARR